MEDDDDEDLFSGSSHNGMSQAEGFLCMFLSAHQRTAQLWCRYFSAEATTGALTRQFCELPSVKQEDWESDEFPYQTLVNAVKKRGGLERLRMGWKRKLETTRPALRALFKQCPREVLSALQRNCKGPSNDTVLQNIHGLLSIVIPSAQENCLEKDIWLHPFEDPELAELAQREEPCGARPIEARVAVPRNSEKKLAH